MHQGVAVNMEDPEPKEVEPEVNPETGLPINKTANFSMYDPMSDYNAKIGF